MCDASDSFSGSLPDHFLQGLYWLTRTLTRQEEYSAQCILQMALVALEVCFHTCSWCGV